MTCVFHINSGKTQTKWLFKSNLRFFGRCKCSAALGLTLNSSYVGNLLTRVAWALQVKIITWRSKYGLCKERKLHSNSTYGPGKLELFQPVLWKCPQISCILFLKLLSFVLVCPNLWKTIQSVKLEFSIGQSKKPQDITRVEYGWQSLQKNGILLH